MMKNQGYSKACVGFMNSYYNFQYLLDFVASSYVKMIKPPKKLCASGYMKI